VLDGALDSDSVPETQRTIGIISTGAMGSAIGQVLAEGGARVVSTLAGRSERTARLARQAAIECLPDLEAVVAEAELVLSVAPPGSAESIAADIASASERAKVAPLVADLNAISPAVARRIESLLDAAGLRLVDASISGPPPESSWKTRLPGVKGRTRIYVSGREAAQLAALPFPGVAVIPVGGEVGTASAIKMCTASVYKGSVALLTQALRTARAHGVVEHVLEDLSKGLPPLADGAARSIASATTKSGRYVGEMHEIAATQDAAGLTPAVFEAMADVYAGLAKTSLAGENPEEVSRDISLDDVLERLT
jgi:3-hydroxyisobutyrate dehydrogenase-like beta-hydroxyacid dehydrogenase